MLAIRLQRLGRRGHAQYRVIVQDSRFSPKSGRVVAFLGTYNPHTKEAKVDKEKASTYLSKGAQPSDRLARLLEKEGVELPKWVKLAEPKKRSIKHPEKLRRNRPAGEPEPVKADETPAKESTETETPAQEPAAEEAPKAEEAPAEEPQAEEKPAEEAPTEPTEEPSEPPTTDEKPA